MTTSRHADFFFEIGSPFSYLAATQIEALKARASASVAWRPVVLGAIFKQTGNEPPRGVPAKAGYMLSDLRRWADHYGVPFEWPALFPLNTILAHRALVAVEREQGALSAEALALVLFRAYWVEGQDLSDAQTLCEVIDQQQGLSGEEVVHATQSQEVKDALRAHTDEALNRGVFGAPTFLVGEELFWGNDRLDFVERALKSFASP